MDASTSSKVVVHGRDLADYCRRMRVSNALYKLAFDLNDLFVGYEELASKMRAVSFELEDLAEKGLLFEVEHSF